jgi:RNA polymerase sigma-54 factor
MKIEQSLRLHQQLVMTPQLQQAIRLLQLSRMEFIDEVHKELDTNPVLVQEDPNAAPTAPRDPDGQARSAEDLRSSEKATREVDWEKFLENRTLQAPGQSRNFEELPPIEQNLTRQGDLQEHLLRQVQLGDFTDVERQFAELVIGNLDEKGYLDLGGIKREDGVRTPDLTIEDLAVEVDLDPDDAPLVLELIQNFDPLGVGARDVRECLLVQAKYHGYDPIEITVIDEHLHHLEKHNYQAIARELKLPLEEVYEIAKEIQKLESRPARNFVDHDDRSIGITPDVYVARDEETGEWQVVLNDRGMPRLLIDEAMKKKLRADPTKKEFAEETERNAQWLIRAVEQRRKTIIRVTECIVDKQRDFFELGAGHLKPMILRDVAEDEKVGLHESTISRVTTNKYVHTPHGVFELKYFFNSSIRRVGVEDIASESVKQSIKRLIDAEDKQNPLSDQAIVESLEKAEGIKIARRTVAKYREMLGILASSKRKRVF